MKKNKTVYVKVDSRNRLTIPKQIFKSSTVARLYKIYEKDGKIILDPIQEVAKEELWLFDPKNKHLVDKLKRALQQKSDKKINLDVLEEE
jgi:ABC-type antimicrobial peptide transport system permease subunit